jgi:hypothetical protein
MASVCTPNPNINPSFVPTPYPTYSNYESPLQTPYIEVDDSESDAASNNEGSSNHEYNLMAGLLIASKTRLKARQPRVFRECRGVRRRKIRATAYAPSSGPLLAHRGSAMEPTLRFHTMEQDHSTDFAQLMSDPFDVELMANSLWSFSLDRGSTS